MPTAPISMRKLKEILRLKYGAGLSHRQIALSAGLQSGTELNRNGLEAGEISLAALYQLE